MKVPYICKPEDPSLVADPDENTYIDAAADSWLRQLQSFFRRLPKEMFVNRILKNEASCEVSLKSHRLKLVELIKECEDFPYGLHSE